MVLQAVNPIVKANKLKTAISFFMIFFLSD
jgi:hypothetical protein